MKRKAPKDGKNPATEIVVDPREAAVLDLMGMSSDGLKAELRAALTASAEGIWRAAQILKILSQRGEDVSRICAGVEPILRMVASGTLLPESVLRFAGRKQLMGAVSKLAHDEQSRLAAGDRVKVVRERHGVFYVEEDDPTRLRREEIEVVFGPHGLRTPDDQTHIIKTRSGKAIKDRSDSRMVGLTFYVEKDEAGQIQALAERESVTVSGLLRRCLQETGII